MVAGTVLGMPAAHATSNTVYVDAANRGIDGGDCAGSARACATIAYALTQVATNGTVIVAAGSYDETVTVAQPVTLIGHDATIDSLDIGDASGAVDVSGFTITSATAPLVNIHDTVAGDDVAVHDNHIIGTTDPQTAVQVGGNSAGVSITENGIAGTSDGIELTGNHQTAAYTVADNTFAISSGSGAAIALAAPARTDSLALTLGGNTGAISSTGQTITESGDGPITITSSGTPNTIAAPSSSITSADVPSELSTLEDPTPFAATLTSGSAIAHARLDLAVTPTNDIPADQIRLWYHADGETTYKPITLDSNYHATVTDLGSLPGATGTLSHFQLATGDLSPPGTLTVALSLDEVAAGSVVNTVASTSFDVAVNVNSAPTAVAQPSVVVARNGSVGITLDATDADHDPITAWANTAPSHGVLSGTAPNLTYTPNPAYSGPDTFTFTASDGKGGTSASATVSITVNADDAPVASDFTVSNRVDRGSSGVTIDLTPHASDTDHDSLTYSVSPTSQHGGTVSVNSQGIATYVPAANYGGADSFTYWVMDGTTDSTHATVMLTVDRAPVAVGPSTKHVVLGRDVTFLLKATDADGDKPTFSVSQPLHGQTTLDTGSVTYTAPKNWAGATSFTFTAHDGHGGTDTGTVHVIVLKALSSINAVTVTPSSPTSAQKPSVIVSVGSVGNESNGKVTVRLGTAAYSAKVTGRKAAVQLPAQAGGKHTIMVTFGGTATTLPITQPVSKTFSVTRVASSIKYTTDPLQLTTSTADAVAIVHVSTVSLGVNAGTITISEVGVGRLASGRVSGGVVRLHLPQFSLGQHNLTVSYAGTAYIAPSSVAAVERVALGH
jgi:hypothetical protein